MARTSVAVFYSHFIYLYGTSTCSDGGVFFPIKINDFNGCKIRERRFGVQSYKRRVPEQPPILYKVGTVLLYFAYSVGKR